MSSKIIAFAYFGFQISGVPHQPTILERSNERGITFGAICTYSPAAGAAALDKMPAE